MVLGSVQCPTGPLETSSACGLQARSTPILELQMLTNETSALKAKAEHAHPDEYRRAAKRYTFDDN